MYLISSNYPVSSFWYEPHRKFNSIHKIFYIQRQGRKNIYHYSVERFGNEYSEFVFSWNNLFRGNLRKKLYPLLWTTISFILLFSSAVSYFFGADVKLWLLNHPSLEGHGSPIIQYHEIWNGHFCLIARQNDWWYSS